jgi:hypothetical protein
LFGWVVQVAATSKQEMRPTDLKDWIVIVLTFQQKLFTHLINR